MKGVTSLFTSEVARVQSPLLSQMATRDAQGKGSRIVAVRSGDERARYFDDEEPSEKAGASLHRGDLLSERIGTSMLKPNAEARKPTPLARAIASTAMMRTALIGGIGGMLKPRLLRGMNSSLWCRASAGAGSLPPSSSLSVLAFADTFRGTQSSELHRGVHTMPRTVVEAVVEASQAWGRGFVPGELGFELGA